MRGPPFTMETTPAFIAPAISGSWMDIQVVTRIRMTLRTNPLGCLKLPRNAPSEILNRSHGFKVTRIAPRAIPTEVIDDKPGRNDPACHLVSYPVRRGGLPAPRSSGPVSLRIQTPLPRPALHRTLGHEHLAPESLFKGH